ncbi:MAG: hypothetical protein A2Y04_05390 [Omnitrophica WOR_2 bacterium GWC2_45_7]|nr:MAG: hypothetical protein A2Y04_05390 [Omnitrophica WOR_2 bacterium GWC2_45_7]
MNQSEMMENQPMDILLVDDNDADIKITERAFKRAKFRNNLFVACDGQEALDFIFRQGAFQDKDKYPTPDVILLDINMPKLNGFEVLQRLKSNGEFNYIPVVMLTSSRSQEDIFRSYSQGAASYIQKPVEYENFTQIIDGFNFYWHVINKLPDSKYLTNL